MVKRTKKQYRPFSFRLSEETVRRLDELRGALSWNKFFTSVIRSRDGAHCYFCGTVGNLEEHHVVALKDGGKDTKENKILLCVGCHKKTENWGRKKGQMVT